MAVTEINLTVGPERIFEVLSDPNAYADWVVGSDTMRDADPSWPAVGSRFHAASGPGRSRSMTTPR